MTIIKYTCMFFLPFAVLYVLTVGPVWLAGAPNTLLDVAAWPPLAQVIWIVSSVVSGAVFCAWEAFK